MTRFRRFVCILALAAVPLIAGGQIAMAKDKGEGDGTSGKGTSPNQGYAICQPKPSGGSTCTCYTNQCLNGCSCTAAQAAALGGGSTPTGPTVPPKH